MLIQGLAISHALVVIVFTVRILLRDDLSSAARLAWIMVMLFTPYFGVFVYLLFGEINLGRTVHQRHNEVFVKLRSLAGVAMGSCDRNLDGNVVLPQLTVSEQQSGIARSCCPMPRRLASV